MKKILCAVLLVVCFFSIGCNIGENNPHTVTRVKNYGVVQKIDGEDELFVFIPYVGRCPARTCDDGSGLELKVGDLISLEIVSELLQTEPFKADVRIENLTVHRQNVEIEYVDERYVLTADFKPDDIENYSYIALKEIGDAVYFKIVGNENKEEYCSAEILSIDGERLSLGLNMQNGLIQQFLD